MKKVYLCCVENWIFRNLQIYTQDTVFEEFTPTLKHIKELIFGIYTLNTFGQVASFLETLWWLVSKGEVETLIFLSNYGVYKPSNEPLSETSEIGPMSLSGAKALIVENFLNFASKLFPVHVHILRLFNVYGPYQKKGYIVADILDEVINGNVIKAGDMKKIRDLLYIEDFIEVLKKVLKSPKKFSIYNVASGAGISIKELIEVAIKIARKPQMEIVFDPTRIRDEYDYDYVVADISRVKKELKWEPRFDLEEGLKLTYQWYLGNK